jgi:hypothetical protein
MSQFVVAARQVRRLCGGPASGELSGGNWMVLRVDSLWEPAQGAGRFVAPYLITNPASRPTDTLAPRALSVGVKIVTWLILPVVICLSQRLSHACLSISNLYCETANGSLNQLSFI